MANAAVVLLGLPYSAVQFSVVFQLLRCLATFSGSAEPSCHIVLPHTGFVLGQGERLMQCWAKVGQQQHAVLEGVKDCFLFWLFSPSSSDWSCTSEAKVSGSKMPRYLKCCHHKILFYLFFLMINQQGFQLLKILLSKIF